MLLGVIQVEYFFPLKVKNKKMTQIRILKVSFDPSPQRLVDNFIV